MRLFKRSTLLFESSEQVPRNVSFCETDCSIVKLSEGLFSVVFTTQIKHRLWLHETETHVATKINIGLLMDHFYTQAMMTKNSALGDLF